MDMTFEMYYEQYENHVRKRKFKNADLKELSVHLKCILILTFITIHIVNNSVLLC